jgi:putative FmdB family regulatory protein
MYDFQCKKCEIIEEKLISLSALETTKIMCSTCGEEMVRLIGAAEFKMSGAPPKGWKPKEKNQPKSEVRNIHDIRRVEYTK